MQSSRSQKLSMLSGHKVGKLFLSIAFTALTLTAPVAGAATWEELVGKAAASKNKMELGDGSTYSVLERHNGFDTVVDDTKSHQSDYFSAVGYVNLKGEFTPFFIDVVSENWVLDGDIWTVDQFIYRVTLTGEIRNKMHYVLVKETSGRVLDHRSIETSDEEFYKKWELLKSDWILFITPKSED